jgi:hypothetical protein
VTVAAVTGRLAGEHRRDVAAAQARLDAVARTTIRPGTGQSNTRTAEAGNQCWSAIPTAQ